MLPFLSSEEKERLNLFFSAKWSIGYFDEQRKVVLIPEELVKNPSLAKQMTITKLTLSPCECDVSNCKRISVVVHHQGSVFFGTVIPSIKAFNWDYVNALDKLLGLGMEFTKDQIRKFNSGTKISGALSSLEERTKQGNQERQQMISQLENLFNKSPEDDTRSDS